jgi:hypothetical protein
MTGIIEKFGNYFRSAEWEIKEGTVLKLKRKRQKYFKKTFFEPDPSSVVFVVNEVYKSNDVEYCKTTDSYSERGTVKGLHPVPFLKKNFEVASKS